MKYYYTDQTNASVGPVTEEDLKRLYQNGALNQATYVIPEGESTWKTYGEVFGAAVSAQPRQPAATPGVAAAQPAGPGGAAAGAAPQPAAQALQGLQAEAKALWARAKSPGELATLYGALAGLVAYLLQLGTTIFSLITRGRGVWRAPASTFVPVIGRSVFCLAAMAGVLFLLHRALARGAAYRILASRWFTVAGAALAGHFMTVAFWSPGGGGSLALGVFLAIGSSLALVFGGVLQTQEQMNVLKSTRSDAA